MGECKYKNEALLHVAYSGLLRRVDRLWGVGGGDGLSNRFGDCLRDRFGDSDSSDRGDFGRDGDW
jgi:hypothetical protein